MLKILILNFILFFLKDDTKTYVEGIRPIDAPFGIKLVITVRSGLSEPRHSAKLTDRPGDQLH